METSVRNGRLYIDSKKVIKFYQNGNELKIDFITNSSRCNNSLVINGSQIHKVEFEDGTTHIFEKVVQDGNIIIQGAENSKITIGDKKY
jgi:hypothetical protein